MSNKPTVIERARADLQGGRPDKARDRLTGHLHSLHRRGEYSEAAYLALGETYFVMKDFARAGAAWLMTERSDADAEFCAKAFFERYGSSDFKSILRAIKPRAPSEDYPPMVRERLSGWGYRYIGYRGRAQRVAEEVGAAPEEDNKGLRPIELGCMVFVGMVISVVVLYVVLVIRARH